MNADKLSSQELKSLMRKIINARKTYETEKKSPQGHVPISFLPQEEKQTILENFNRIKIVYNFEFRLTEQTIFLEDYELDGQTVPCISFAPKSSEGSPILMSSFYELTTKDLGNIANPETIAKKMVSVFNSTGSDKFLLHGKSNVSVEFGDLVGQYVATQLPGYYMAVADIMAGEHKGRSLLCIVKK